MLYYCLEKFKDFRSRNHLIKMPIIKTRIPKHPRKIWGKFCTSFGFFWFRVFLAKIRQQILLKELVDRVNFSWSELVLLRKIKKISYYIFGAVSLNFINIQDTILIEIEANRKNSFTNPSQPVQGCLHSLFSAIL